MLIEKSSMSYSPYKFIKTTTPHEIASLPERGGLIKHNTKTQCPTFLEEGLILVLNC